MDFKCRQIMGALIILSSSDREKFNENTNNFILETIVPLLPSISIEGIRQFLRNNPAVCSEIKYGRKAGYSLYDQPIVVLLYYAFFNLELNVRAGLPSEIQHFFNNNFKNEIRDELKSLAS